MSIRGSVPCWGEGSYPTPSPDDQWIAFIQGKKEEKQLWIMDSQGANAKQISNIQGGLERAIQWIDGHMGDA